MSILGDIATGGLLSVGKGIAKLVSDYKSKKMSKEMFLASLENELPRLQAEITATEAKHPSVFVSGWRPFVGWTCGAGLAYQYILMPVLNGLLVAAAQDPAFPTLDLGTLTPLLLALLGLAGYRSVEKLQGKARD